MHLPDRNYNVASDTDLIHSGLKSFIEATKGSVNTSRLTQGTEGSGMFSEKGMRQREQRKIVGVQLIQCRSKENVHFSFC